MVRIIVDDHVIAVPKPAVTVSNIIRRNAEVEAIEPEAAGAAATQTPAMIRPEAAAEMPVLPGMIKVVVRVITASVVADPVTALVDVRGIGMAGMVGKVAMVFRRVRSSMKCRWSMRRWGGWTGH
jgi:hypothetical protein